MPVDHPTKDEAWKRDVLQAKQHELIERYDIVIMTDVDEILAPDPRYGDLADYLDGFDGDFVTCRGYELIHLREREPALDPARDVMQQRGWWFASPAYCKPLLARVPMYWHGGMHARTDGLERDDGRLHLLHLHRADYELCLARHRQRVSIRWTQRDWDEGWGYQNRIVDPDAFERWFYEDTCAGVALVVEAIPAHWRGLTI